MNKKIILIEDDKDLQEIIKYNFSKEKYDVVLCSDGEEALDLIKHEMPDLVILDWMLPNLSGVEILRQIRASKNLKKIPIIMLTARTEESDKLRAFDTGADDYITKPFSNSELIARTKALLRRVSEDSFTDTLNFHDIELNRDNDKVWGNQIYVEERTVDVHVGRLRRALNRGKVKKDPIRTVRSAGYSLNENYS